MVGKHTAVSLRHAHLLEVLLKRAGQKQTHMETQDWSTVQVFRLRDFNNAPTCCLCHDSVALWTSEHCCLYLKSGRIKLLRVSSNLQKLKNITSLIKKPEVLKSHTIFYAFLQYHKMYQWLIKWCSSYVLGVFYFLSCYHSRAQCASVNCHVLYC